MTEQFHSIADHVTVIERGWLNCNQIVMTATDQNVLIDSGYGRHADETLRLVGEALGQQPLHRLINTHCHSDHMGGNRRLQERYACRITIPEGEVEHVTPWTAQSCWSLETDQYAEQFEFDDTIAAGEDFDAGGLKWRAVAAPGHDMGALLFWCEAERILITGDALWERGMGFVWPSFVAELSDANGSNTPIHAAFATLDVIEALHPRLIIPGHGAPFVEVVAALEFTRSRLAAFAKDPAKNARHVVKTLFVFALLDKGEIALSALPEYLASVPVYRDMSERFLGLDFDQMAAMLMKDLIANGAVKLDNASGLLTPMMRA